MYPDCNGFLTTYILRTVEGPSLISLHNLALIINMTVNRPTIRILNCRPKV